MEVDSAPRTKVISLAVAFLILVVVQSASAQTSASPTATTVSLPNPVLVFLGPEFYMANGQQFTRYRYAVYNFDEYPAELFAASPNLPPCGTNTRASRTWIDFYAQNGRRLNGFCALSQPKDLNSIWFAIETDVVPPSWIYVEFTDRATNTKYKSGLVETVQ